MKIAIIIGTRPEIIKLSSIIRYCEEQKLDYFIIHTNQHYSENMDKIFFKELKLSQSKYNLNIGSGNHGEQTGKILIEIEKILFHENPDIVLVQGDTNTVLAGALVASKIHIKIGHVEAGLRSYDRKMPEEINRVITDHISDYLFVPTEKQKKILLGEGISKEKIFVVGNTIVDATFQNINLSRKEEHLQKYFLKKNNYFLVTMHRAENTDDINALKNILISFEKIYNKYRMPLFYPIHPRTRKMLDKFKLKISPGLILHDPVGYLEFLQLLENTRLVLTDSGGVQEESCILGVPCVTLRENTERPETVEIGANIIVGTKSENVLKGIEKMLCSMKNWKQPFGDGNTGKKIIEILTQKLDHGK